MPVIDQVDWGNSQTLNLHGDMSLGLWLRLRPGAVGQIIGRVRAGTTLDDNCAYELVVSGTDDAWDILYLHDTGTTRVIPTGTTYLSFDTNLQNAVWYYICFSRDATAKTVTMYKGSMTEPLAIVGSAQSYTNNPDGGGGANTKLIVGNIENSPGAYGEQQLDYGDIEQYYIWDRTLTLAEHEMAMAGEPSYTGLVLACLTGDDPEVDISGNGFTGIVTNTILIAGH